MTTRQKRYGLLLDEMLPRRNKFPQINNYHNVRHIVHDLRKSGASDEQVIKVAKKQNRIVITKNIKDFRELGRAYCVDIIGVTETTSPEKLDNQIMAKLRRKKQKRMSGQFAKITS
ncbi:DUF5615 family PIN-like protein [Patescibacteria group bacterium]|nr:DUF5615 family PIN-like protein [Patescibacteria group bacterium]